MLLFATFGKRFPHHENLSPPDVWQNWQAVGKTSVLLRVKSNVLIQCQASGLRSNPQTFISPPWAISGGIRGPKETKSWWIELISPPVMDGPVHRGLENGSIVHLSLRLPCPSMICAWVVKATSGQKTSLSPSHWSHCFFFQEFTGSPLPPPPQPTLISKHPEKQDYTNDKQT